MECVIIGGGPAGLNAALILGRARRKIMLIDDGKARNAVTTQMHGYLTREGISPARFRKLAYEELVQYPHILIKKGRVQRVQMDAVGQFQIHTSQLIVKASAILLATGLKESLPAIRYLPLYYGSTMFSCPYCDGWELRDKPLIVIAEGSNAIHYAITISQWSKHITLCTNGQYILSAEEQATAAAFHIKVKENRIERLIGNNKRLQAVQFADGTKIRCSGGFVSPYWEHASSLAAQLGCQFNEQQGVWQDGKGRTSVQGVYTAGDTTNISPAQAIIAAADGVKAAISIDSDLQKWQYENIILPKQK